MGSATERQRYIWCRLLFTEPMPRRTPVYIYIYIYTYIYIYIYMYMMCVWCVCANNKAQTITVNHTFWITLFEHRHRSEHLSNTFCVEVSSAPNVPMIYRRVHENVWFPIKISLKFVPKGMINNIISLVQIMAWRRPGDKPLSEPMIISLPTHICIARPQWVKKEIFLQIATSANRQLTCSNFNVLIWGLDEISRKPFGGRLNTKISYQQRDYHYKDKTFPWQSYFNNGNT